MMLESSIKLSANNRIKLSQLSVVDLKYLKIPNCTVWDLHQNVASIRF